ncbi:hypothetical protein NM688_g5887 [Phlebia brevispora]|uniref:Uncharacterized protein n=1 Tax=Phlebia brevispora TaxID=194682 RepID=A0ACC1SNE6_9APHY|nr:hypothetical protein NM688_g5887 [Phlebia brevispora]
MKPIIGTDSLSLSAPIDRNTSETSEALSALSCVFPKPIELGSTFKLTVSFTEDELERTEWTRVPAAPIPDSVLIPRELRQPATAADIPDELYDLIVERFTFQVCEKPEDEFTHALGHSCKDELQCQRNYVRCNKRNRRRVSGGCIRGVVGRLDAQEQLQKPWIHNIGLLVLPNLPQHRVADFDLNITGPLQGLKHVLSSIYPCPRYHPRFSSGIRGLFLTDVHFKYFVHLFRLVKEMPSVVVLMCERVTWDALSPSGHIPLATPYLARDDPSDSVWYSMCGCTDDTAASWLAVVLGITKSDVLDQNAAISLWAMASAWKDGRQAEALRLPEEIRFSNRIIVLFSPTNGIRHRRQVGSISLYLGGLWNYKNYDWVEIDSQLGSLNVFRPLQDILLVFDASSELLEFSREVLTQMPYLAQAPQRKCVFKEEYPDSDPFWIEADVTEDGLQETGDCAKGADGWAAFFTL